MVPLRIAVLTNAYPPAHAGGAAHIAEVQVEMLKQAGHEVRVWSPEMSWITAPVWARLGHHLKDLFAKSSLVGDILAWKPDILLSHNLTGCGFATPRMIKATGVRWFHVLHDIQLFEPSGQLYRLRPVTFWQLGWAFLRFHAFGRPDAIISPTHWLIEQHLHRFLLTRQRDRADIETHVIPNPGPVMNPVSRGVHEPLRLLFVGHISPAKGSRLLLKIIRELRTPFELHIVGEGPDQHLFKSAGTQVVLHGKRDREGVLRIMRAADILLVPSEIHENQPTVILEAASVNLPVIASRRGGIPETLGEAGAEMICSYNNAEAWCQAIQRLTDPEIYLHQSRIIQHLAEEHDPTLYAQRFLALFTANR
ncbi:glycosyltransferase [Patescibacteria group bacterium]|nr:glycosyltransferase [Patescibacteria group bacterium]MBP9710530.1 glycosyltransferase [Patescibacteria group bacterium]